MKSGVQRCDNIYIFTQGTDAITTTKEKVGVTRLGTRGHDKDVLHSSTVYNSFHHTSAFTGICLN